MKPASERGLTAAGRQRHTARLSASERRQAIVTAALRVFSEGSYAGATTAQIAREAGISEPILYRHFASKKELYFACLDEAWSGLRDSLSEKMDEVGPVEAWRELAAECGADRTEFARRWRLLAERWSFAAVNELIERHNRWYPAEARLPMDPRSGDFVLVGCRPYEREPLDAHWIL